MNVSQVDLLQVLSMMGIKNPRYDMDIKAPCHNDHTPSMHVYKESQGQYDPHVFCFSCGKRFDAIRLWAVYNASPEKRQAAIDGKYDLWALRQLRSMIATGQFTAESVHTTQNNHSSVDASPAEPAAETHLSADDRKQIEVHFLMAAMKQKVSIFNDVRTREIDNARFNAVLYGQKWKSNEEYLTPMERDTAELRQQIAELRQRLMAMGYYTNLILHNNGTLSISA